MAVDHYAQREGGLSQTDLLGSGSAPMAVDV
jgi:hypothetical protein